MACGSLSLTYLLSYLLTYSLTYLLTHLFPTNFQHSTTLWRASLFTGQLLCQGVSNSMWEPLTQQICQGVRKQVA